MSETSLIAFGLYVLLGACFVYVLGILLTFMTLERCDVINLLCTGIELTLGLIEIILNNVGNLYEQFKPV